MGKSIDDLIFFRYFIYFVHLYDYIKYYIYLTIPQKSVKLHPVWFFGCNDNMTCWLTGVLADDVVWWRRCYKDSLGFGAGELLVTMDPSGLGNQVVQSFQSFYSAKVVLVSFEFGRVRIRIRIIELVFENGRILFKRKGHVEREGLLVFLLPANSPSSLHITDWTTGSWFYSPSNPLIPYLEPDVHPLYMFVCQLEACW